MGIANKLYRLAKAYLHVTSERIDRAAREVEAESELKESARVRETARQADLEIGRMPSLIPSPSLRAEVPLAADYKLLGIPYDAELSVAEDAWRRLAQRADPKRFPAGSEEEKQAAEILGRINAAYQRIREAKSPTEGRFGKLEL